MVYIIGVCHGIQHTKNSNFPISKEFQNFILENIKNFQINVCAEEMNKEALDKNKTDSLLKMISKQKQILYLECDPNTKEREKNKIDNKDKREMFWIKKLKPYLNKNILFICGYDHLRTFKEKLNKLKIKYKIISETCWGEEFFYDTVMKQWLKEKLYIA